MALTILVSLIASISTRFGSKLLHYQMFFTNIWFVEIEKECKTKNRGQKSCHPIFTHMIVSIAGVTSIWLLLASTSAHFLYAKTNYWWIFFQYIYRQWADVEAILGFLRSDAVFEEDFFRHSFQMYRSSCLVLDCSLKRLMTCEVNSLEACSYFSSSWW